MIYIMYYIIVGVLWTGFLEFMTIQFPNMEQPVNWRWGLRIPMILFWPVTFIVFVITLIIGIYKILTKL